MAIDYRGCAIPNTRARVFDRITRQRAQAAEERACRIAVKKRDKGKCVVPGCKDKSIHLHHVTYRSRGGRWRTENICSLCVRHRQMVHAGLIQISGNADQTLFIEGDADLLGFTL